MLIFTYFHPLYFVISLEASHFYIRFSGSRIVRSRRIFSDFSLQRVKSRNEHLSCLLESVYKHRITLVCFHDDILLFSSVSCVACVSVACYIVQRKARRRENSVYLKHHASMCNVGGFRMQSNDDFPLREMLNPRDTNATQNRARGLCHNNSGEFHSTLCFHFEFSNATDNHTEKDIPSTPSKTKHERKKT